MPIREQHTDLYAKNSNIPYFIKTAGLFYFTYEFPHGIAIPREFFSF